jgi:hypothetical protein
VWVLRRAEGGRRGGQRVGPSRPRGENEERRGEERGEMREGGEARRGEER